MEFNKYISNCDTQEDSFTVVKLGRETNEGVQ